MHNLAKTPIKIGTQTIRNRVVSSPVSINMAKENGQVSDNIISFFSNLAKNNLGMVTIGAISVSDEGRDTKNGMGIGKKEHFEGLKKLSDSIKQHGAAACAQLFHVGAQGNSHLSGVRMVGPSKGYIDPNIGIEAEELTIDEIKKIEDDFVRGIIQADDAGFNFIEVHMAHGYLLHEFLSPHTNKRNDQYGGSEENRFRIVKNIINKLKDKRIIKKLGARVTGDDFTEKGLNIKKIENLIKYLDENSFCYSVTAGIYETAKQKYIQMKRGSYWEYSKKLKSITKTPVIAQGNITSVTEGEKILSDKKGDMFAMAQALIADPELVKKSFNGKENEVFNCLAHMKVGSCHRCRYVKQKDHTFDCVTPSAWRPIGKSNTREKDLLFWKQTIEKLKLLEEKNN